MNNYLFFNSDCSADLYDRVKEKFTGMIPLRYDYNIGIFYHDNRESQSRSLMQHLIKDIAEEDVLITKLQGIDLIKLNDDAHICKVIQQYHFYINIPLKTVEHFFDE